MMFSHTCSSFLFFFAYKSYLQHYDAFNLDQEDGRRFAANGGQRTVTVLVYLNDVAQGGATAFPNLNLQVQPRQGMALVFFPATVDGALDRQALHAALPAVDTKYVSQIWIRQQSYFGQASKRLASTILTGPSLMAHEMKTPIPLSSSGMVGMMGMGMGSGVAPSTSTPMASNDDAQPMSP